MVFTNPAFMATFEVKATVLRDFSEDKGKYNAKRFGVKLIIHEGPLTNKVYNAFLDPREFDKLIKDLGKHGLTKQ